MGFKTMLRGAKSKKQIAIYDIIHLHELKISAYLCTHICVHSDSARQQEDNDKAEEARAVRGPQGYSQKVGRHPPGDG